MPPLALPPVGLGFGAGCELLVAPDVVDTLAPSGGVASWSLVIPSTPSLRGTHLYQQALELGTVSAASPAGDAKID